MLTAILILLFTGILYLWNRHNHSYWRRHNVRSIKPTPILGNLTNMKKPFGEQLYDLYQKPGFENEAAVGIYLLHRPALLLKDLNLIKNIMIKNFQHFADHVIRPDPIHDRLAAENLFFTTALKWKDLRPRMSPIFSSGKIKQMYLLMMDITKQMEYQLDKLPNGHVMDVKQFMMRFTTDLIGTTAFGLDVKSLENANNEFYKYTLKVMGVSFKRNLEFTCLTLLPKLVPLLKVKLVETKLQNFLQKTMRHVFEERERTGTIRNDLIDTLRVMQKEAKLDPNDPANDFQYILAQVNVFLVAGAETSSSTSSYALYELAKNPDLQDRLHAEINEAFEQGNGCISYEKIQELTYLTQVVDETLRLYPIAATLERQLTMSNKIKEFSLLPELNYTIPKGIPVYISQLGIHRDEKYWKDPLVFDPERFSAKNRSNINWNAYMPFGIGPRNCIGMRLGLLQTKLGLVHILRNHHVSICEKTPKTVEFDPGSMVLSIKGGNYLRLNKIVHN